jgi:hypothetical protein
VESLQGSLSSLPSSTELNAALAALQTKLDALEAQIGEGVSSEDLQEIEEDLSDLLTSNNIYSEDLTIDSEALLEFAENLKDRVAIINGDVSIHITSDLDHDRLQAVVSKMKTVVGDLNIRHHFPYKLYPSRFNQYPKLVLKAAGLDQMVKGYKFNPQTQRKELGLFPKYSVISSHDLRRSFATNFFSKIPTPVLMEMTGHAREATFMSYIGRDPLRDAYADRFMEGVLRLQS